MHTKLLHQNLFFIEIASLPLSCANRFNGLGLGSDLDGPMCRLHSDHGATQIIANLCCGFDCRTGALLNLIWWWWWWWWFIIWLIGYPKSLSTAVVDPLRRTFGVCSPKHHVFFLLKGIPFWSDCAWCSSELPDNHLHRCSSGSARRSNRGNDYFAVQANQWELAYQIGSWLLEYPKPYFDAHFSSSLSNLTCFAEDWRFKITIKIITPVISNINITSNIFIAHYNTSIITITTTIIVVIIMIIFIFNFILFSCSCSSCFHVYLFKNQSINQSINRSIDRSIDRPMNQAANADQSINPSINQSFIHSFIHSADDIPWLHHSLSWFGWSYSLEQYVLLIWPRVPNLWSMSDLFYIVNMFKFKLKIVSSVIQVPAS